jgi:hypothetical protein
VKKLLEMTPPKGKDFLHKIEHILEREKNWVSVLSLYIHIYVYVCIYICVCARVFLLKYYVEITMVVV